jgi:hypothetical protein
MRISKGGTDFRAFQYMGLKPHIRKAGTAHVIPISDLRRESVDRPFCIGELIFYA